MATSPNFNWPEPDNTDLVKNGALAIRTAVDAIDTSLVDLKGGTTGQVLAKASGTDMDFSWVAQDDSNAIQNAIVDAKGDLIGATAADTPARLAIGANGTMLVANSVETTGLKWTTATDQYPWQTWSPSYTRLTIGNGTVTARYQQIGKTVHFYWRLVWGSTTSVTSFPFVSTPVAAFVESQYLCGQARFEDVSPSAEWLGTSTINTANEIYIAVTGTAGAQAIYSPITNTSPVTWTTGDIWIAQGTYEAA